jgi:hypothetical protein
LVSEQTCDRNIHRYVIEAVRHTHQPDTHIRLIQSRSSPSGRSRLCCRQLVSERSVFDTRCKANSKSRSDTVGHARTPSGCKSGDIKSYITAAESWVAGARLASDCRPGVTSPDLNAADLRMVMACWRHPALRPRPPLSFFLARHAGAWAAGGVATVIDDH